MNTHIKEEGENDGHYWDLMLVYIPIKNQFLRRLKFSYFLSSGNMVGNYFLIFIFLFNFLANKITKAICGKDYVIVGKDILVDDDQDEQKIQE